MPADGWPKGGLPQDPLRRFFSWLFRTLGRFRMTAGRRRVLLISTVLLLALAAGAFHTWRLIFARLDRQHARFYQAGQSIGAFLADYCQGLREAAGRGEMDPVMALYSERYATPGRGTWGWGEATVHGGVVVQHLEGTGEESFGRSRLGAELARYLGELSAIEGARCKIGLIEELTPPPGEEVTLTVKLVIDGTEPRGLLLQDHLSFRWWLAREEPGGVGQGWRIVADQPLSGFRAAGRGDAFAAVDPVAAGIPYRHRRDPKLDPEGAGRSLRFQVMQHGLGGLAVADYDGDGRPDIFFADGMESRLYRNVTEEPGEVRFVDVTGPAGLTGVGEAAAALFVDLDNDGDRDLVVTRYLAANRLFLNRGDGTFEDRSSGSGFDIAVPSTSITALDYDRDGLLDLYVAVFGNAFEAFPRIPFFARNGEPNRLFRNLGGGRFRDVTDESGTGDTGWSLAVAAGDLDGDAWPDLVVANDFGRKSLFRNQGDGTFREVAQEAGVLDFSGGMGVALGDLEGDGDPDLYTSNIQSNQRWFGEELTLTQYLRNVVRTRWALIDFGEYWALHRLVGNAWRQLGKEFGEGNSLFRNLGDGRFQELRESGANRAGWSWGVLFFDFDNDADLDLYAANGWISNRPNTDL